MYMGVIGALISYSPDVSGLVVAGLQCVIKVSYLEISCRGFYRNLLIGRSWELGFSNSSKT
jgi:hypothetical protein